jgi:hypothetical protein
MLARFEVRHRPQLLIERQKSLKPALKFINPLTEVDKLTLLLTALFFNLSQFGRLS